MARSERRGRRDYPDAPSSLEEWWERVQWALHAKEMSARALTRMISPGASGEGTVGRWLSGDVLNASLRKIQDAAEKLGVNELWLIFGIGEPYDRKPASLPRELEKALLLTEPAASPFVMHCVTDFYAQHHDVQLTEKDWRSIRLEFEEAERRSIGILEFVEKIRELSALDAAMLLPDEPPTPPNGTHRATLHVAKGTPATESRRRLR
jgi:hypothetical protein